MDWEVQAVFSWLYVIYNLWEDCGERHLILTMLSYHLWLCYMRLDLGSMERVAGKFVSEQHIPIHINVASIAFLGSPSSDPSPRSRSIHTYLNTPQASYLLHARMHYRSPRAESARSSSNSAAYGAIHLRKLAIHAKAILLRCTSRSNLYTLLTMTDYLRMQ